jgi:riboflavin kinase/FMN adenylyltransferase
MELIRGLHNLRPRHCGSVVTIGNFDGVHRGHQVILTQLQAAGAALGLPDTVMIFEPQPQEFFQGDNAPARLMHWRDKVDALAAAGVARVLCVRFDAKLRALTARQFIQQLLVDGLGCRHLVIGDDFRFGCDRSGDFAVLQAAGREFGFAVNNTDTVSVAGDRVSSTRIRTALAAGDFAFSRNLVGAALRRLWACHARRQNWPHVGVPTANIPSRRRVSPVRGIFAVTVEGIGAVPVYGAASVGKRPTVQGLDEARGNAFAGFYRRHLRQAHQRGVSSQTA